MYTIVCAKVQQVLSMRCTEALKMGGGVKKGLVSFHVCSQRDISLVQQPPTRILIGCGGDQEVAHFQIAQNAGFQPHLMLNLSDLTEVVQDCEIMTNFPLGNFISLQKFHFSKVWWEIEKC